MKCPESTFEVTAVFIILKILCGVCVYTVDNVDIFYIKLSLELEVYKPYISLQYVLYLSLHHYRTVDTQKLNS